MGDIRRDGCDDDIGFDDGGKLLIFGKLAE
jgi:hypothetical protein